MEAINRLKDAIEKFKKQTTCNAQCVLTPILVEGKVRCLNLRGQHSRTETAY